MLLIFIHQAAMKRQKFHLFHHKSRILVSKTPDFFHPVGCALTGADRPAMAGLPGRANDRILAVLWTICLIVVEVALPPAPQPGQGGGKVSTQTGHHGYTHHDQADLLHGSQGGSTLMQAWNQIGDGNINEAGSRQCQNVGQGLLQGIK